MSEAPNIKASHIDLLEMARFLVLPGATELLQAFARIPPGRLRDSVIQHAEVIAQEYSNAPPDQQMPDPLYMASQRMVTPPPINAKALPGPPKRKPQTPEEHVLKLRLENKNKHEIVVATGLNLHEVETIIRKAREAGVKLPKATAGHADSAKLPTFNTDIESMSTQARSMTATAAVRYGHSLESWVAAKKLMMEMRLAQKPMDEISAAIRPKLPDKILWGWLYQARRAGIELPLRAPDDAEIEPTQEAPQKAATGPKPGSVIPAPGRPIFTPLEEMTPIHAGGRKAIYDAAAARGLTPQAYFDLRESIILHRWAGKGFTEIYSLVGQDMDFIRNTISNAKQKGVDFPPITSDFNAAAWTRAHPVTKQIGTGRSGFRKDVATPVILAATDNRVYPPPKQVTGRKEFPLRVEDAGKGILASIVREGLEKGQTLEDYFALRRQAVELMRLGHTSSHIAKVVGIKKKQAENWRTRARNAGHLPPVSKIAAE